MATPERSHQNSLAQAEPAWLARLLAEPSACDPFVALGLLEQLTAGAPRIGGDGPVAHEALRVRHAASLRFQPGDLAEVRVVDAGEGRGRRVEIVACFMGLTGTGSPLPTYLTREAARTDEHGRAQAEFLDLFHHRLHSLLYRALRKLDWPSEHAREPLDPWCLRVLALLGVDVSSGPARTRLRPVELLRVAPLLLAPARSAESLGLVLTELLADDLAGAQVEVRSFVGGWAPIDEGQRIRLGLANSRLGVETVLGERCLDRAGKADVVIGPLDQAGLRRFATGAPGFERLRELLDLVCDGPLELELELHLRREGEAGAILGRSRLGDDAWLGRSASDPTATDARVRVGLGGGA